jgi:hypothetical protein
MRRSQFAFVPTVVVLLLTVGNAFPETPVSAPLFARGTSQWQTSVASDGTRFLVAWSDFRSGVGEIRVTLADANGSALTPEGIPISSTTNAQEATVAWDGRDYIVVWQGDGGCYYKRITADGVWLDSAPRLVLPGDHSPRIARSDYGTIVIGSTFFGSIDLAVIGTVGTGRAPIHLNAGSNAVAGCGRTDCLVAWSTNDANLRPQIVGRRISSDGRLLDGEPVVLVQDAFDPRLTSNGTELLLTWREPAPPAAPFPGAIPIVTSPNGEPSPATPARSIHGRFIDGAPFIILSDARRDVVDYTVTAGQGEFIVGWQADLEQVRWLRSGKKRVVEAARVSASGNVGATFPLIQSMISSRSLTNRFSIATTGRELFACWTEDVGLTGVRVAGGISHGNEAVVPSLQISGATKQSAPAVAYGAGQYAVVWLEDPLGTGRRTLLLRRFTATLAPIDQTPVAISGDGDAAEPHVAFDGSAFVLVWNEGAPHARWFTPDGSLSAPLVVGIAAFEEAIATHDGQTALLLHDFADKLTFTLLERDRTIKTVDLGLGGSGGIHLAWNGTEYIVVESNTKLLTIRSIRADGAALAPELYRVDADWSLIESPAIACGGNECVVAWWKLNGGVTAVRLRGAQAGEIGEPFTDLGDFRAAPVDRFEPEVVSMADDFLVTSISKGTLFARSISSGVYGNEQQLVSTAERLFGHSVAAGKKKELVVAYVRAAYDAPYSGAQRVFLRVLDMQ